MVSGVFLAALAVLMALALHHQYFCWIARRAISAVYPNHPELSMFGSIGGPLGIVFVLTSFPSVEVIHKLPESERARLVLHYRVQLAFALLFVAPLVAVML